MSRSQQRAVEDGPNFGEHYHNPACALARRGIKPYKRCDYCQLRTTACSGLRNGVLVFFVVLLVSLFLVIEQPLAIRINIAVIFCLLLLLLLRIDHSLDRLAQSDHLNLKLNKKLKARAQDLESQVRERTRSLEQMVSQDSLTGLVNRTEFEGRLQRALNDAYDTQSGHVLCFIDLDRFKVVNDTSGHAAGDELLRQVTTILTGHVRETDTVARWGGDEFGILFEHCHLEQSLDVLERIRQVIEDYRFSWGATTFSIGASMGVIGITAESGSAVEVMAAVDDACFRAKERGRNCIQVYEYDEQELKARHGQMHWVNRITYALDHDELALYLQPIVALHDERPAARHFEVLMRLREADGRVMPPMAFLPAAERFNLMRKIDRWVLAAALRAWGTLNRQHPTALSINLSGESLNDEQLVTHIIDLMGECQVDPQRITFEVTETVAISNMHKAVTLCQRLQGLGCRISLDDFGSGLSSFGYLKSLPVDFLKIDGGFVRDILKDEATRAMVEVINHIGHILEKKTIAEFVESEEILAAVRGLGVDYAQGYALGRPTPMADYLRDVVEGDDVGVPRVAAEGQGGA